MERRDSQLLDVEPSQFMETKWIITNCITCFIMWKDNYESFTFGKGYDFVPK